MSLEKLISRWLVIKLLAPRPLGPWGLQPVSRKEGDAQLIPSPTPSFSAGRKATVPGVAKATFSWTLSRQLFPSSLKVEEAVSGFSKDPSGYQGVRLSALFLLDPLPGQGQVGRKKWFFLFFRSSVFLKTSHKLWCVSPKHACTCNTHSTYIQAHIHTHKP